METDQLPAQPAKRPYLLVGINLLLGLVLWFGLLVITAPLVGHATWHAYRALVPPACG